MVLVAPNHIESGTGRLLGRETAASQGADSGKYVVTAGQVLYSKIRPALNKVAIAVEDCLCSADMYAISLPDRIDTRFARYFMSAKPFHDFATAMSMRVKMPKVNREELADGPWLLPQLTEQRAIAAYLDRETAHIDTLIEEQQRLIELLRERRWSVVERSVALLDWNTPLRAVAVLIQTGPFGSQLKSDEYEDGGTPVINPSHIVAGEVVPDPRVAVGAVKTAQLARHAFEEGDLVAARRGELGRCAVIKASAVGFLCGTGSALIRFNQAFIEPAFGAIVFSSRRNRDALALASVGSTMDNLNSDIIGSLRVPVPALEEQRGLVAEISEATAKIDTLIAEAERFIELSRERRSALITAAVTGQIDVREAA
ncbi:restriction endonuclease subunit S [Streptomyces galbus]|uniref:Restriction endonuclease subunit S n=2 Tax=Streptomyces galbus TaxID=33898 RepID=A0A4U5WZY9_STRGB|nr:restriction endonuclease subunit S [Streptomyces galbus]